MILFKKILKWAGVVLVGIFVVLFIIRWFHMLDVKKIEAQVAKIHATKLTLDDVMGKNLPPDPGVLADQTLAGVDANNNGIRDDVELAVFKAYSNSAKTRAVLLQYALALQMEAIQPILNKEIATEVVREQSRAYDCVSKILPKINLSQFVKEGDKLRFFVEEKQRNTLERKQQRASFVEYVGSYAELNGCDIDYSTLPN